MPPSARYEQLRTRIAEVETNLLPAIDINGNYNIRESDLTRSYCLLCHAEIEAFIEDLALEVVREVFNYWKADNSRIPEIVFNLACHYKSKKETLATLVNQGMVSWERMVDKNHGIKEHNLDSIFAPIGYPIDKTLVTVLHNFGDTRGDIAHKSFRAQQQIDPATERSTVNKIVSELEKFDLDFYKYKIPATHSAIIPTKRRFRDKLSAAMHILRS